MGGAARWRISFKGVIGASGFGLLFTEDVIVWKSYRRPIDQCLYQELVGRNHALFSTLRTIS